MYYKDSACLSLINFKERIKCRNALILLLFTCRFQRHKTHVIRFDFQEVIGKIIIEFCLRAMKPFNNISTCLTVYFPTFLSVQCLASCIPVYFPSFLAVQCLASCLPVYLSTSLPSQLSTCLSNFLFNGLYKRLPVYLSTFLSSLLSSVFHVFLSNALPLYTFSCLYLST